MTMLVYMVGRNIPLYGIDIDAYSNVNVDAQSIPLQAISGDMKNCSIFIIGLWLYMTASMLAMLMIAIMSLDNTKAVSEEDKHMDSNYHDDYRSSSGISQNTDTYV